MTFILAGVQPANNFIFAVLSAVLVSVFSFHTVLWFGVNF